MPTYRQLELIVIVSLGWLPVLRAQQPATAPAANDPPALAIEKYLRSAGIDPRDVRVNTDDFDFLIGSAAQPHSPFAHLLLNDPLRVDAETAITGELLAGNAGGYPVGVLNTLSRLLCGSVWRGLSSDPLAKHKAAAAQPGALPKILTELHAVAPRITPASQATSASQPATTQPAAAASAPAWPGLHEVPASVQEAGALLLLTMRDAREWVHRANRLPPGVEAGFLATLQRKLRAPTKTGAEEAKDEAEHPDPDYDLAFKRFVELYPTQFVMVAGQDLILALELARNKLAADATLAKAAFDFKVSTDLGWVILADGRNNIHKYDGPVALIIDTGGDDAYAIAGGNADCDQHCVSVALDLAGNDIYKAEPGTVGGFGAGLLGIGLLWDDAGNDTYEAEGQTQGCGQFGFGLLLDNAGDDKYKAIDAAQGSALAGFGVLIDRAGNDRYESYRASQACANCNAAAALIDLAGNDEYILNDADIRYPAAQSPAHNNSLGQGFAIGWRADETDGVKLNGGVAVLVDAAGDDKYTAGIFAQGAGYWYGTGMLIDLGGNDSYLGQWYVQGASAHYAVGVLVDRGGNDTYRADMNMAQGAANDVGLGVLIDDAGNDTYYAPTLSLGASHAAGTGLFIDKAGDDRYFTPKDSCLGWVNGNGSFWALVRCYGLFFDLGGNDTYAGRNGPDQGRPDAGNAKRWGAPAAQPSGVLTAFGLGFDR